MRIETSWDDGHELDLRLADLLRKYKLPATFYINTVSEEKREGKDLSEDDIVSLAKDFEIGGHTVSHPPDMKALSKAVNASRI